MRKSQTKISENASSRPAGTEDRVNAAMLAIRQGQPAEAERIAHSVLDLHPRHNEALHLLGMALLTQHRPHEALASLEQGARTSRDPFIETLYALALPDVGRKNAAIEWLQRATSRVP